MEPNQACNMHTFLNAIPITLIKWTNLTANVDWSLWSASLAMVLGTPTVEIVIILCPIPTSYWAEKAHQLYLAFQKIKFSLKAPKKQSLTSLRQRWASRTALRLSIGSPIPIKTTLDTRCWNSSSIVSTCTKQTLVWSLLFQLPWNYVQHSKALSLMRTG